jgi:hypothetical protein
MPARLRGRRRACHLRGEAYSFQTSFFGPASKVKAQRPSKVQMSPAPNVGRAVPAPQPRFQAQPIFAFGRQQRPLPARGRWGQADVPFAAAGALAGHPLTP